MTQLGRYPTPSPLRFCRDGSRAIASDNFSVLRSYRLDGDALRLVDSYDTKSLQGCLVGQDDRYLFSHDNAGEILAVRWFSDGKLGEPMRFPALTVSHVAGRGRRCVNVLAAV